LSQEFDNNFVHELCAINDQVFVKNKVGQIRFMTDNYL
jgi:hypothetical protein